MTFKMRVEYANVYQRDRELCLVDGIWRDDQGREWMPSQLTSSPNATWSELEFNYRNHTPRHIMVRYVGREFDEDAITGSRWHKHYDVICLDSHDEEGRIEVLMLKNSLYEIDIIDGDWYYLPPKLAGRNITPKNEKEYDQIVQFLEHEFMAEVEVYRRIKDYENACS